MPPILQACSQARIPAAGFTCSYPGDASAPTPDGPPYFIRCTDNSTTEFNQSIASWSWDFGDGGSSTDQNPVHTYSDASRYDITLSVTTFCGSQYTNKSIESINIYCSVPVPGFTTNVTEGYAPLAVGITDTSVRTRDDITRWTYWFDDNHFSNERAPVFVYTLPGIYTINQTVWKDCVQLGSSLYPPSKVQIRVKDPKTAPGNETSVTQVPRLTTPVTAAPSPAATSDMTAPVIATTIVPTKTGVFGTGSLVLDTTPPGAQIFIDDVARGTTPATIGNLAAGSHTLRFELDGYQTMTMPVIVPDRDTSTLATSLIPESGGVAILPVIILSLITLCVLVGGIYLYLRQRAMNDD